MRAVAVSAAAASLLGALTGCVRLDTTAPSAARAQASATTQARFGTVDCRQAKCIALTFDAGPSEHSARLLRATRSPTTPGTTTG